MKREFFERSRVVEEIIQGVLGFQPMDFSLVGAKFLGKSRILAYLASPNGPLHGPAYGSLRPAPFNVEQPGVVSVLYDCNWPDAQPDFLKFMAERLLRQLEKERLISLLEQPPSDGESPSYQLRRIGRQLSRHDYRLVLLMDNFDSILAGSLLDEEKLNALRPLARDMALVVATERPLHDLDPHLAASPLFNLMDQIFLGLLDPDVVHCSIERYAERFGIKDEGFLQDLEDWTGAHPFLLSRIEEILLEVDEMLPAAQRIGRVHLPLIRLRLAEHGRLLFETLWKEVGELEGDLAETVHGLIQQMVADPLPIEQTTRRHAAALNWLINQTMVRLRDNAYHIFSPLFREFLAARLGIELSTSARRRIAQRLPESLEDFTPQETSLLRYFWAHKDEVISVQRLLEDVWKRPNASTRRVQEGIRRLRQRLDEQSPPIGIIENEWGRGYRFVPADTNPLHARK